MILGIECTAHTFGIGIVNDGKILCNVRDNYSTEKGGIIPMDAAKHHREVSEEVYRKALEEARIKEDEIKAIALSNAPGLAPCLNEGLKFAKKKADKLGLKLIPVNHCVAHLEIGRITGARDPVLLYASGANTQIIAYSGGKYRVFGETLDIGIGNFIELPYTIKGMDVAFSGMLTSLKQKYDSIKSDDFLDSSNLKKSKKFEEKDMKKEDLAFSLQETSFAMLVEASERAMAHVGKKELVIGGGVGCNTRLQEMCGIMCKERNAKFFAPSNEFLQDNGGMIAYLGETMFNSGIWKDINEIDINPRERTDYVIVVWR